jgi:hypothetical protein
MASVQLVCIWFHSQVVFHNSLPFQAFKYCTDPLFPKPETTVMFSAIKSIAKVVGILFAAPLLRTRIPDKEMKLCYSIPAAALLTFINWQSILYTPKTYKILIFYAYTFAINAIFQYLFLIIPRLCAGKVEKPKTK